MQSFRGGRESGEGKGRATGEEDLGADQIKDKVIAIQRAIRSKITEPDPNHGQNQTREKTIIIKILTTSFRLQQTLSESTQHFQITQPV